MIEKKDIAIGNHLIVGEGQRPIVVAELSANHGQSLGTAKDLVSKIADAGADAVKLQTYTPESMTLPNDDERFRVSKWTSDWDGKSAFDLYKVAQTPWEWHAELFEHAKACGLEIFSSPFSEAAVDFLESIDCPAYKVASYENTDVRFLRAVAKTGKPIIMSTGASTLLDVSRAHQELVAGGASDVVLMKCTSAYPAPPQELNVKSIPYLSELFGLHVGFSDHSVGIGAAVAAVTLGAKMIEKHVMLDSSVQSPDSHFSLTPTELKQLVDAVSDAFDALSDIPFGPTVSEEHGVTSKRSLFFTEELAAGELISPSSVASLRPVVGVPASELDNVIGRRLNRRVGSGDPVQARDLV